jgi:hypothetical protein
MKRGDADHPRWDHLRSLQTFKDNDINIVFDNELSLKKKFKKPNFLLLNYTLKSKDAILQGFKKRYARFVNDWFYEKKDGDPLQNVDMHHYLSDKILIIVCCISPTKEYPFIDFILCRTLQTDSAIILKHLAGFDEPSKYTFSVSSKNNKIEVYYDGKIWLDRM